jgi:hypothetical protein
MAYVCIHVPQAACWVAMGSLLGGSEKLMLTLM